MLLFCCQIQHCCSGRGLTTSMAEFEVSWQDNCPRCLKMGLLIVACACGWQDSMLHYWPMSGLGPNSRATSAPPLPQPSTAGEASASASAAQDPQSSLTLGLQVCYCCFAMDLKSIPCLQESSELSWLLLARCRALIYSLHSKVLICAAWQLSPNPCMCA